MLNLNAIICSYMPASKKKFRKPRFRTRTWWMPHFLVFCAGQGMGVRDSIARIALSFYAWAGKRGVAHRKSESTQHSWWDTHFSLIFHPIFFFLKTRSGLFKNKLLNSTLVGMWLSKSCSDSTSISNLGNMHTCLCQSPPFYELNFWCRMGVCLSKRQECIECFEERKRPSQCCRQSWLEFLSPVRNQAVQDSVQALATLGCMKWPLRAKANFSFPSWAVYLNALETCLHFIFLQNPYSLLTR